MYDLAHTNETGSAPVEIDDTPVVFPGLLFTLTGTNQ